MDPLKGIPLQQPLRGFFERLVTRVNASAQKRPGMTIGNVFIANASGDLDDSGSPLPTGTLVTAEYVGERYITDAELPEAGTEEGARHGSYRIGLLTDNDYVFFDENGSIICYGTTGVRIIVPINATGTITKFAVFDSTGRIRYRTATELLGDLGLSDFATEEWVSEHFITECAVPEAGTTEESPSRIAVELKVSSNALTIPQEYGRDLAVSITTSTGGAENITAVYGGVANQRVSFKARTGTPTFVDGGTLFIQANFTLDSVYDRFEMECISPDNWAECGRYDNG